MKKIEITGCRDCPFKNHEYNDFSLGDADSYRCNLLKKTWEDELLKGNQSNIDFFISFHKKGKVKSDNKKTLNNCPLIENSIKVIFDNE